MREGGAIFVEAGDMLSHPALRHYGDALKWEKIYEANKERTENPDYSYVGQTIIIPSWWSGTCSIQRRYYLEPWCVYRRSDVWFATLGGWL